MSRWAPVLAYAALISILSSRPGLSLPGGWSDKAAHGLEFAGLAALLWRALAGAFLAPIGVRGAAAILAACVLYAAMDEVHQSFVPTRFSSLADVIADAAGAAAALGALWRWTARRAAPPAEDPRGPARAPGPILTLLSRSGCRLCEEAERVIMQVQSEIPFTYEKVDVAADVELDRRYGLEVPVVLMEGRKIFKHRVDAGRLRRRVVRALGGVA